MVKAKPSKGLQKTHPEGPRWHRRKMQHDGRRLIRGQALERINAKLEDGYFHPTKGFKEATYRRVVAAQTTAELKKGVHLSLKDIQRRFQLEDAAKT
jgi:hypothetical protein